MRGWFPRNIWSCLIGHLPNKQQFGKILIESITTFDSRYAPTKPQLIERRPVGIIKEVIVLKADFLISRDFVDYFSEIAEFLAYYIAFQDGRVTAIKFYIY